MPSTPFDPDRRRLLTGRAPGTPPPWADRHKLVEFCSRCGACATACPQGIVVMDGGYPSVDFARGECTFCGACADACPEPIFNAAAERPWEIVARIGESCLARTNIVCQSCRDACPTAAIRFELALRAAPQPHVDADACTGCGACVSVCPVGAITIAEPREAACA